MTDGGHRARRPTRARNAPGRPGVSIVSVRTCLGCRQRTSAPFLLRVVVQGGTVVVDRSATLPGRGAWVHPRIECVDTALNRKAFGRALRRPDVAIDADALREAIAVHQIGTSPEASKRTG